MKRFCLKGSVNLVTEVTTKKRKSVKTDGAEAMIVCTDERSGVVQSLFYEDMCMEFFYVGWMKMHGIDNQVNAPRYRQKKK